MNMMTRDFFEHQSRTLNALYEVSRVLGSSLDLGTVARRCLRALSDNLDLERGLLLVPSEDRSELSVKASFGVGPDDVKVIFPVHGGFLGKVYTTGMPIVVTDPTSLEESEAQEIRKISPPGEANVVVAVPVTLDRRCAGVLVANRSPHSATMIDEDLRVMKIIASLLAQTVHISELISKEKEVLERQNRELQDVLAEKFQPDNLVVQSGAMQKTMAMVRQVAGTDAAVLLRGESGTGKTLLARTIHFNSGRRRGAFVEVNCAALPASLIESELFGHEKGAFTGAHALRIGRFEMATGGTIFLDEIGELPLETQAKILRVFQEGTFERLGSSETLRSDARIICATNCDLEGMVREKKFREDLYYRLMVVPVHVPPLRNRRSDIVPLVLAFLRTFMARHAKKIAVSREALDFLQQYEWPGNVRELENTLERTVVLATEGQTLSADDIPVLDRLFPTLAPPIDPHGVGHSQPPQGSWGFAPRGMHSNTPNHANISDERRPYQRAMLSREEILQALDATNGHQTMAARALGVTLRQLRYKIQLLELDPRQFRK
ncbi:MAG: sigma 54-interacting transcriptional regulator [Fibrobacterota bacterium]|nr:MAG: sigma 54-interacting transcriptional regulator [Fibrobacterota bacterium]